MNHRERDQIQTLNDKINEIEKSHLKIVHSLERILDILEDDTRTSRKGVVTQVRQLEDDVEKLMYMNKNIRRVSIFFLSIVSAIATIAIKSLIFGKDA